MTIPGAEAGWENGEALLTHELPRAEQAVAILDAGAQYVDLIQKACERLGYRTDILPLDTSFESIERSYGAFIVSGGPASTHAEGAPMPDPALWQTNKGVLGICYGQQAMALAFGGKVETGDAREDGSTTTHVDNNHPLFARVKPDVRALFTHGDYVTGVPEDFEVIGKHKLANGQEVVSAMARANFASVQFHPEVFDETPHGYDILQSFLGDMSGLTPDPGRLERQTAQDCEARKLSIAEKAGERQVIAFASGGVDSTVATILASQVIDASKLHIYYFDNGFMRDEDDDVINMLQSSGLDVQKIDATEAFEQATVVLEDGTVSAPLIEVSDPKLKRKIIGNKFAELKDEIAASLGFATSEVMLLQGTNAADRIESGFSLAGGQTTEQIKEHHNQVRAIKDMEVAGLLIEPLNDLHKDEIRRIGEYLNLPEEVVWRHPFPGPGDAIRILCHNENDYEMPDSAIEEAVRDYVFQNTDISLGSWLLPTRSVGVGGDARSYVVPVALQGTPDWPELARLAQGEQSIPAQFPGKINRVVYALGENPLRDFSLTPTSLGRAERAQLRHADRVVFEEIRRWGLMRAISQCPVVLLPLSFDDQPGSRSIVLRPIKTSTYLTVSALVPGRDVDPAFINDTATRLLLEVPGISQVFLELTNKPPATTEWE